jgi:biotin carboxylase
VTAWVPPGGFNVRVDSHLMAPYAVPPFYDSLLAKLIVWDWTREAATERMLRALSEYEIEGLPTLVPFHRAFLATRQWQQRETGRDLLADSEWLAATAS